MGAWCSLEFMVPVLVMGSSDVSLEARRGRAIVVAGACEIVPRERSQSGPRGTHNRDLPFVRAECIPFRERP